MKGIPAWIDGALFGLLIGPLMFALKIFCPSGAECFADPFLIIVFSPLFLLNNFFPGLDSGMWFEIVFISVFWAIVIALGAHTGTAAFRSISKTTHEERVRGFEN